ncbi:MAG: hypothetical protein JNL12_19330, partial [Planctomycetes bacterium]|nr:hypothetical protein [Planctomycetota bacterium]
VFLRVLQGKANLEAARDPRAVLCWLGARLSANAARADRRRRHHEENAMNHDSLAGGGLPAPPEVAERTETARWVAAAVDELPDELRQPLLLRCQDDLTLAQIGTVLAVPVSTVHERIERASARVRARLQQRGQTIAPAALPGLVAALPGEAPPVELAGRLRGLFDAPWLWTVSVARRAAIACAAGVVVVAAVVAASWPEARPPVVLGTSTANASPGTSPTMQEPSSPARQEPATERVPGGQPGAAPAAGAGGAARSEVPASTFAGVVRDVTAAPVAGVMVHLVAGGGLKPFDVAQSVRTDADGRFRIVHDGRHGPVALLPDAVRLVVVDGVRRLLSTGDLSRARAVDAPPIELVLPANVGDAASTFRLEVVVHDAAGSALAGVPVHLFDWQTPAPPPGWGTRQASAVTEVGGAATVDGRGLGPRWLFVDGRSLGLQACYERLEVRAAGSLRHEVVLARGGTTRVRIVQLDDSVPEYARAVLTHDGSGLDHHATMAADGTCSFTGLGSGTHTLRVHPGALSPVWIPGVQAGDPERLVRCKPLADPRDVGDHAGEVHGELVDAATGEVVPFGPFAVRVERLRGGVSSWVGDRLQPHRSVQQMEAGGRRTAFHEGGLEPGEHALVVDVPGYALAIVPFPLGPAEVRAGVRVQLVRPPRVTGTLVGADGTPLAKARVFVVGDGPLADAVLASWAEHRPDPLDVGAAEPSTTLGAAWTDAAGAFVLGRLPPGLPLRLVVHHADAAQLVHTLPAMQSGERFELPTLRASARSQ